MPIATNRARGQDADLIVIGGGIYGIMLALEAGRRGLRALVLERDSIGAATTASWFRIVHGGFRYLQSLDFVRTRQSSAERRWFLNFAPDLVRPLSFLLPLYGGGLKRPTALSAAFLLEQLLTPGRNRGLPPEARIAAGKTLSIAQTIATFEDVRREGLLGAALWQDAVVMHDRALLERLRHAAEGAGAIFEEFAPVEALQAAAGRVDGVVVGGANHGVRTAPVVINAAGPWSESVAGKLGSPVAGLFQPILAFNLLLDRKPLTKTGLAIAAAKPNSPLLFLMPYGEQTFAGTWYDECSTVDDKAEASEEAIDRFLAALAEAAPTLGATRSDVVQTFAGWQPLAKPGSTKVSDRPLIVDHAEHGGPSGLFSVSGVKYTTARQVAAGVIDRIIHQQQT